MHKNYKKTLGRKMLRTVLLGTGSVLISTTFGQGAAIAQDDRPKSERDVIVVTARKMGEESIQDVPQSIRAFGASEVEDFGMTSFDDYARLTPSISFVDQGPGQAKVVLRGVSTGFTRGDQTQDNETTAIYIDETPISINGSNPDYDLFDIERIEVLRGPQGTLYGAGAMAGAIRIITKKPNLSNMEIAGEVNLSTWETGGVNYNTNLAVNIPLIEEMLALRVVAYHRFDEGYIDNIAPQSPFYGNYANVNNTNNMNERANSQNVYGGRALVKFAPAEALDITGSVIWQKSKLGGRFQANETTDTNFISMFRDFGPYEQFRVVEEKIPDEHYILNLTASYDFGWADFTSVTSYLNRDWVIFSDLTVLVDNVFGFNAGNPLFSDYGLPLPGGTPVGSFAPVSPIDNYGHVDDFVQEIRLSGTTPDDRLNWLVGGFLSKRDRSYIQIFNSVGFESLVQQRDPTFSFPVFGTETIGDFFTYIDLDQKALFGEVTVNVTDRLEATAGVRWFEVKSQSDILFRGLFQFGQQQEVNFSKENGFNPKFNLSYSFTDSFLAYATAAKGFRVGGTNEVVPAAACSAELAELGLTERPAGFESDSLWNYEIGAKASSSDNRFTLNGSVYYIDWSNIQTTKLLLGCGFSFRQNSGGAVSKGFELELSAEPIEGFVVSAGGSYTDATISGDVPNLNALDGDRLPLVPKINFSVMAQYTAPITSELDGFANFSYSYQGKSYDQFDMSTAILHPAYGLANLRLGFAKENWKLSAFAENLFDKREIVFSQVNVYRYPVGTETIWTSPRKIGVTLQGSF